MTPEEALIQESFRRYYGSRELELPPEPTRREWAFMFPGRMMERHHAFGSADELRRAVKARAPAHLFYSSAYFDRPGEPNMHRKGWRGADLFFDLDLDPTSLPPAERTYEPLLARIRQETVKLLDFLVEDFALENITAVFSGQKGFHLHARDPRVLGLGGPGRREIVDYITATGLELDPGSPGAILYYERPPRHFLRIRAEGGWGRRLSRRVAALLEELRGLPEPRALERARSEFPFLTAAQARKLAALSRKVEAAERIREGSIDQIAGFPWRKLVDSMKAPLLAKPDQLVTGDVHRLARAPTSLHGGTALRVTPLAPDAIGRFDPLRDSVALGDDPVAVEVAGPIRFRLGAERFSLEPGVHELPEFAAVHLLVGGWRLWVPPPKQGEFSVKLADSKNAKH